MPSGYRHTPATLAKLRGRKCSPETRQRMSNAQQGRTFSAEQCANIGAAQTGRKVPEKTRAKHRRENLSPETLLKMSVAHRRENLRPETIAKMRAAGSGKKQTAAARAKLRAANLGKKRGPANPAWAGGVSRLPYGWEWSAELREEVRRRDDYCCQTCGASQTECTKALYVHHIDYDKENSDPVNLVALCASCHSKTNTNREHWTAFFRAMAIDRDIAEMRRKAGLK